MRILIVEDEKKTAAFLKKGFSEYGFSTDVAEDGEEGLQRALTGSYEIIILDVMLPIKDGWSFMAELRRHGREIPVIMLTARDAVMDRIKGFELGADDYLVKPFLFSELFVRVQAILRRGPTLKEEVIRVADLEVDLPRYRAVRGGKPLGLTPKEFALLSVLVAHPGEVVSMMQLAERIGQIDYDKLPKIMKTIDALMVQLRAKVDGPFERKLIQTVQGMGYVIER